MAHERKGIQAPPGTYSFLEQIHNKHDGYIHPYPPIGKVSVLGSGDTTVRIHKEDVCPLGCSCMDFTIEKRLGDIGRGERFLNQHAHITDEDMVTCINGTKTLLWRVSDGSVTIRENGWSAPTPDIKDMLQTLRSVLPQVGQT